MGDEEDVYTEEETIPEEEERGWADGVKNSFACACFGVVLFFGSFPLLYWNEGRAVDRYDALHEGQADIVSINATYIDSSTNGQLVYISADLTSNGSTIIDPVFGVSISDDLKLRRSAEMYQWVETTKTETVKNSDGSTRSKKSYHYDTKWSYTLSNSNSFQRTGGHENPTSMPYDSQTWQADEIYAGVHALPQELVDRVDWFQPFTNISITDIPDATLRNQATTYGNNGIYIHKPVGNILAQNSTTQTIVTNPNPVVGDVRVTFASVEPGRVSIVAKQDGNTFTTYKTSNGEPLLFFRRGNVTSEEIFEQATTNNNILTWFLRFLGLFLMWLGIDSMLHPLEAFFDCIPCLGDMMSAAINLVALVFTFIFGGFTIAIAWLIHHPIIGVVVLSVFLILIGGLVFGIKQIQKNKPKKSKRVPSDDDEEGEE